MNLSNLCTIELTRNLFGTVVLVNIVISAWDSFIWLGKSAVALKYGRWPSTAHLNRMKEQH